MKKTLWSVAAVILLEGSALAQGTINFNNGAAGVNAPISDLDGTTKLAGAGFIAQLFAGAAGTAWNSLAAIAPTATFGTGVSAGYLTSASGGGARAIPNVAAGTPAAFQFRVWSANFATWDAAWAAYQASDPSAKVGVNGWSGAGLPDTVLTSAGLGGGTITPPNMVGLTSFQLHNAVPEPSTIALGVLGIGALLLRRRK